MLRVYPQMRLGEAQSTPKKKEDGDAHVVTRRISRMWPDRGNRLVWRHGILKKKSQRAVGFPTPPQTSGGLGVVYRLPVVSTANVNQ